MLSLFAEPGGGSKGCPVSSKSRISGLIALRRRQTGEPRRELKQAMKGLAAELSPAQKATIDEALHPANSAADGREHEVGIDPDLKHRILPSAFDRAQQELEAAVFHALVRASDRLGSHPTAWCYRFGQLVRQVRPEPDRLRLTLNPVILGPLLAELLPTEADPAEGDALYGTAGVRMRMDRSGLELYLVDSDPRATVVLSGITRNIVRDAKAYLAEDRLSSVLRLCANSPDALSPTEKTWLHEVRRVYGPVHVTSGLLRRIRLFADTPWIKSTPRGTAELVVEWAGAPTQQAVLAMLCHPATTIAAARYSGSHWPTSKIVRFDVLGSPANTPRSPRVAEVLFRALPPYHGGPDYLDTKASSPHRIPLRSFHRPALLDDLVALRCLRTGEPLERAQRRIREAFEKHPDLRRMTSARSSSLDTASSDTLSLVREAALPSAHSVHQRLLETSLLLAARGNWSIDQHLQRGHEVFAAVSPGPYTLVVELVDGVAPMFFRAILPRLDPEHAAGGIPGLRVEHSDTRLVLRLLDRNGAVTDASVNIEGIDKTRWKAILAELKKDADGVELINPMLQHSPALCPSERSSMDFHRWDCGPVGLGSALLRRVGSFAGADLVDAWPSMPAGEIHVETDGPSSFRAVVNTFAHPILGIVHGDTVLELFDDSFARIVDTSADAAPFAKLRTDYKRRPALVLRQYASSHASRDRR